MHKEKGKFCSEVLAWEPWCAASGPLGHQFLDFIEKRKPRQVWGASWSCGGGRCCAAEVLLAWQLARTGAEAGLPCVGRAWANLWGHGAGKSVGVHETLLLLCLPACSYPVLVMLRWICRGFWQALWARFSYGPGCLFIW